ADAASTYRAFNIAAQTITLTGSTGVTSTVGFASQVINALTITDASAVTVTAAASLYISGPPIAAGSVTITNPYALWVDSGISRFDGGIRTAYSTANVSTPPTDAELDSAFGDPTTVGSGFVGVLDDADAGLSVYLVFTTGTANEWFYVLGTKAI
ncbi:MAG: hypothetical protein MN733_23615, partial [Nitrososphaera sp.]|nr:hypothetical protein [Nitrososphaera sp.]